MEHISSGTETTDVDATTASESNELAAPPTQITSIDGFFNRKRGRPPKNRFVEVYKSAQHSPQAIFTSFKLEKNDQATCAPLAATSDGNEAHVLASLRLGGGTTQPISAPTATDLTPGRNSRKRARVWTVDSQRSLANGPNPIAGKATSTLELAESRAPIPLMFSMQAAASSKSLERVSVVRAAGTFYPENASAAAAAAVEQSACGHMPDQPEDLSMRAVQQQQTEPETVTATSTATSTAIEAETETGVKLMQFKQLLDLYQRQVLLPSFLAAGQLDMRLLLEQAAQQKMLLINAAAAVAATAAVAAAPTATTSAAGEECAPKPNTTATPAPAAASRVSVKRTREQDIPMGYLKFRFNEDCKFERCGYRNHQSHFHCNRRDCHYSFCDKTRFVQHTARHERMDTLMGDDFRQYRANMRCHVTDCSYATSSTSATEAPKKSSHFHCRKCDYVCTDSNKVVAHRRLHMRLEYVRSAGFRKIASSEVCDSPACTYALRHTHYHCISCDGSVLSRAQLSSHRHRRASASGSGSGSASGTGTGNSNQPAKQLAERAASSLSL